MIQTLPLRLPNETVQFAAHQPSAHFRQALAVVSSPSRLGRLYYGPDSLFYSVSEGEIEICAETEFRGGE
jgi:hypothetical protein